MGIKRSPGCKCCGFAWTFNVFGCGGAALAGATIELRQAGVLIDSCVTGDGTGGTTLGRCILNVPAGTYAITITGPTGAGFNTSTSSAAIAATKTTNTTLTSDTSHTCWTCCPFPLTKTIHSTDSDGPITLTFDPTSAPGVPMYILETTGTVATVCGDSIALCTPCVSPGSAYKKYELTFNSNCTVRLRIYVNNACCSGQNVHYGGPATFPGVGFVQTIPVTLSNCSPLNLVFSVPTRLNATFCSPGDTGLPTPGGGGTLTFTS